MNVTIASAWRDSAHRVDRYRQQVRALDAHARGALMIDVLAVHGDSTDDTERALVLAGFRTVACHLGTPRYGSTEQPERMVALSKVGNAIFNAVQPDCDVLVYVESDLIWDAHTIGSLIDMAARQDGGFDVFAPLIFAGDCFYDVWGFRKNGSRFAPFAPYHSELDHTGLTEVDSVGSCLVMRGDVARACRIRNNYCLVGWCEDARAHDFRVAVHPGFRVKHP